MKKIYLMIAALSFSLSACTHTASECDPSIHDPGFLDKLGCVVSGSYEDRVNYKKNEIAKLREEQKALSDEVIELEKQRSQLVNDRAARYRELDKLKAKLASLESSIKSKNAMTSSLQKKIDDLKTSTNEVQNLDESASIMQKKAEIARLQQQYNELLDAMSATH